MLQLSKIKHKYGFDRGLRSSLKNMAQVSVKIPLDLNGKIDLELQQEILKKYQVIKETKEKTTKEKIPDGEKIKEQFEKIGASPEIMKIFENPESLSRLFTKGSEILKNPEIQKKIQELQTAIEKATKEKGIIPDSVIKAAEVIKGGEKEKKKESPWKTSFGAIGWSILLFLVLFMLAELKVSDSIFGKTIDKKNKKIFRSRY